MDYMPFAGNPLHRASNERRDDSWVDDLLTAESSRFLPFHKLSALTQPSEGRALRWLDAASRAKLDPGANTVLLGTQDGIAHWAIDLENDPIEALGLEGAEFSETRAVALSLSPPEAGIVAHARALLDWHRRHRFCASCGGTTQPRRAGSMRKCDSCAAEHFPRTDPVAIMVVWRGDRCLLGRRPGRPPGNFSTLAGFIEQGETIEEAVRREVLEEVGVRIDDVTYVTSQPWPFPSNLMIGCFAHATSDEFAIDDEEIAEARWFTRDEVQAAIRGEEGDLVIPNYVAIAHHILKAWSGLPATAEA